MWISTNWCPNINCTFQIDPSPHDPTNTNNVMDTGHLHPDPAPLIRPLTAAAHRLSVSSAARLHLCPCTSPSPSSASTWRTAHLETHYFKMTQTTKNKIKDYNNNKWWTLAEADVILSFKYLNINLLTFNPSTGRNLNAGSWKKNGN